MTATAMARAFVVAVVTALVADGALALFNGLTDLGGGGSPWWVQAHLVERGRWVVTALLLMPLAARLAPPEVSVAADAPAAWRAVATAVIVVPLLWILATWIVQATLYTVADRWDVDGRVFLASGYYGRLFMGYAPWLLGGIVTRMASRHV